MFLDWFTQPEQNMRFIATTGYLPVTAVAFEERLAGSGESLPKPILQKLLDTQIRMYEEYRFIYAPVNDNLSALTGDFEAEIRELMRAGRARVLAGEAPETVSEELLTAYLQ